MMRMLLVAALTAGMAGCATPYQEMGLMGGVRATQITADTFQIRAQGNGYTDPDTIQRYALRKAAETTLANGYDLFLIGDEHVRDITSTSTIGSTSWSRYGALGSAMTFQTVRPGQTIWVKTLKYPKPDPAPPGLYDAREVLRYLAPPVG